MERRIRILLLAAAVSWPFVDLSVPQAQSSPRVLVVAAHVKDLEPNHYLWAAEMAALRLPGNNHVLEGGLVAALREAKANPGTVKGILEVVVDVYTYIEDVSINCYNSKGEFLWMKNTKVNAGGSEERLARKMFDRTLKKVAKQPMCGE